MTMTNKNRENGKSKKERGERGRRTIVVGFQAFI